MRETASSLPGLVNEPLCLSAPFPVAPVIGFGHLIQTLRELGVSCDTAANRGWKALSNGELVSAAAATGFTCLLTRYHLFGESAARALETFLSFAVVVVDLPQQRWQAHQEQFVTAWGERSIEPAAGTCFSCPGGDRFTGCRSLNSKPPFASRQVCAGQYGGRDSAGCASGYAVQGPSGVLILPLS